MDAKGAFFLLLFKALAAIIGGSKGTFFYLVYRGATSFLYLLIIYYTIKLIGL